MFYGTPIRTDCVLTIEKNYFEGSYRKPKFLGKNTLKVKVLRHSYGAKKGQHTFTLEVLEVITKNIESKDIVGATFRMKGRNLYRHVLKHVQGQESKESTY